VKLYRNLSEAVVQNLHDIFEGNRYADKVIEKVLKQHPKWGARDRRFIAETTYDIVRWYRLFRELSGAEEGDYWSLLATWCIWNTVDLPPWDEFNKIQPRSIEENYERIKSERKIRESIPDWLDTLGEAELPAWWDKELHALNEEAKVVLRVNTLKITREGLRELLFEEEGIETERLPECPDALLLHERQNIFTRQAFKDGLFEVQDAGSQRIAPYLDVKPGMRVIDACAGAGGKTLHLAALMQNKGRIIAMDTEAWKLDELKKRARRAGASDLIEARLIDSSKVIKRLEGTADRVLLDVPCSGLGVLRRNPDSKWKLSLEFIEKVRELQQEILQQYSVMVKPGGMMVYATCSILPSENEKQVEKFLATHGDKFEMLSQDRCWPSEGYDGFFMCRLKRK
jgi:16S rRNA (cytosine967-C5)-methyltransferase